LLYNTPERQYFALRKEKNEIFVVQSSYNGIFSEKKERRGESKCVGGSLVGYNRNPEEEERNTRKIGT
jgi:hypothetical protein